MTAWILAPIALEFVLAASAITKWRSQDSLVDVLIALGTPPALARRIDRVLPAVEVVLAAGLLLAPAGPAFTVTAIAAVLLFALYLLVIIRLNNRESGSCHCFGSFSQGQVTSRTVARNGLLLAGAVVTLVAAFRGNATIGTLLDASAGTWAWLLATVWALALSATMGLARPVSEDYVRHRSRTARPSSRTEARTASPRWPHRRLGSLSSCRRAVHPVAICR
ncbi:MauE/DoxX family redox-associated membrane protein [Nostocoides jenkinsii]|uniref:Methylamine utilisation protein MauE domain-containing protein n=1 Tax=Nostocoides jenkinsii Ben 74 TaxID=1193518 RepID=A0A077MAC1_9MICO|nr:MauE/DoxX family redox-associated membrane protein [Tetrasphaera jenkinsii]CCI51737.1 membrane hypothetical protein [Tetrasphaera jenkinsii Ben 74]